MKRIVVAFVFVLASCAPIAESPGDDDDDDETPAKVYEPIEGGSFTVGDDARPATVFVPDAYDPEVAMPFVLLLHGYGLTGEQMDGALGFAAFAEASSFIYASPTGLLDSGGGYFWNATDACCDFENTNVDDSAYLRAIVDDAAEIAHIDPARVFVLGHSNGGFMAQRLACDHADVFAASVNVAGATSLTDACAPSEGVAMLTVHGTDDTTIFYEGGDLGGGLIYPGAVETAAAWAERNECEATPVEVGTLDLETLAGEETTIERYEGCVEGGASELWTTEGGEHIPNGNADYLPKLLDFMLAHSRE
jgi:polyhydroxybutyrate depolymerase